ncbi:CxxxxCH/CxxCH domain-containing protein [Pseudomonas sp. N040]
MQPGQRRCRQRLCHSQSHRQQAAFRLPGQTPNWTGPCPTRC